MTDTTIDDAVSLINHLAPSAAAVPIRTPLAQDECRWFVRAVAGEVVTFKTCPADCFRFKKFGVSSRDHFLTPSGKPRHLFSKPGAPEAWLNREYVPHIAAYAFALDRGYDAARSTFSLYRKFSRDLIAKRAGVSYETDAEFYGGDGAIHLQIEAKASAAQTARLAAAIETHGSLRDLPTSAAKEVEYVLDLSPRYLWVVGPGSIEPPAHVYAVDVRESIVNGREDKLEDKLPTLRLRWQLPNLIVSAFCE